MKMMLWKEWRETIRWFPIPLIVFSVMLFMAMPAVGARSGGFTDEVASFVGVAAAITAALLGLLQTLPESRADARGLLLGRPVSRRSIYLSKTLIAALVYGASLGIPLMYAAIWLAAVTPETRPGSPLQLLAAVIVGIGCFSFHPAVCWMVFRPARWIGTRTIPIVIAVVVSLLSFFITIEAASWALLFGAMALIMLLVVMLCLSASHAFCNLTDQPPISNRSATFMPSMIMLTLGSVILVTFVIGWALSLVPALKPDYVNMEFTDWRVDPEGVIYNTIERTDYSRLSGVRNNTVLAASPAVFVTDPQADLVPVPKPYEDQELRSFRLFHGLDQSGWDRPVLSPYDQWAFRFGMYNATYHRDGYYLLYNSGTSRLAGYLTLSGIGESGVRFDGPSPVATAGSLLAQCGVTNHFHTSLMIDRKGVYQFDGQHDSLRTLVEQKITSAVMLPASSGQPPTLWLSDNQRVSVFDVRTLDPDQSLLGQQGVEYISELPQIDLEKKIELEVPELDDGLLYVADIGAAGSVILRRSNDAVHVTQFDRDGQSLGNKDYAYYYHATDKLDSNSVTAAILPPIVPVLISGLAGMIDQPAKVGFSRRVRNIFVLLTIVHALLAALLALLACRHRRVSRQVAMCWTFLGGLLGVGTTLAVFALYPRIFCEACHGCNRPIRVDHERCPSCGAGWDVPQRDGCEIFEGEKEAPPVVA